MSHTFIHHGTHCHTCLFITEPTVTHVYSSRNPLSHMFIHHGTQCHACLFITKPNVTKVYSSRNPMSQKFIHQGTQCHTWLFITKLNVTHVYSSRNQLIRFLTIFSNVVSTRAPRPVRGVDSNNTWSHHLSLTPSDFLTFKIYSNSTLHLSRWFLHSRECQVGIEWMFHSWCISVLVNTVSLSVHFRKHLWVSCSTLAFYISR